MHMVANMQLYSSDSLDGTEEVSICSIGVYGTEYIRDEPVPSAINLISGSTTTLSIKHIYSRYVIGNTLLIHMRLREQLDFVNIVNDTEQATIAIDGSGLEADQIYTLYLESYDSNSGVESTLRSDTVKLTITTQIVVE